MNTTRRTFFALLAAAPAVGAIAVAAKPIGPQYPRYAFSVGKAPDYDYPEVYVPPGALTQVHFVHVNHGIVASFSFACPTSCGYYISLSKGRFLFRPDVVDVKTIEATFA
jgi:hypothetical protein